MQGGIRLNAFGVVSLGIPLHKGGLSLPAVSVPFLHVWTTVGNLNTARFGLAGAGTQTAGLCMGGIDAGSTVLVITEEYNGVAWAYGGNLNTARWVLAGAGTQTAGLSMGGFDAGYVNSAVTEEYDGAAWTNGGNLNTARQGLGGAGIQTAGLCMGGGYIGAPPFYSTVTEIYA